MRVEIQPIGECNELSGFTLSLAFDDDGTPTIPSTVHWRAVCIDSGTVLQDWASLSVTETYDANDVLIAATSEIDVDGSLHEMQTTLDRERKAIVVACDKDSGEWNLELTYTVVRLNARS